MNLQQIRNKVFCGICTYGEHSRYPEYQVYFFLDGSGRIINTNRGDTLTEEFNSELRSNNFESWELPSSMEELCRNLKIYIYSTQ